MGNWLGYIIHFRPDIDLISSGNDNSHAAQRRTGMHTMVGARDTISVEINDHAHFITFRLSGVLYGNDLLDITEKVYAALDEPWRYNRLYDIRAFINVLQFQDFVDLAEQWPRLAGRQQPTRFAIVTEDPVRVARTDAYGPILPNITARAFGSLAEAIGWLTEPDDNS